MALLRPCGPVRFLSPLHFALRYTLTRPQKPKQIPTFDTLHELQPMAIRDQPVGLNIYARTQATHRAFRVGY